MHVVGITMHGILEDGDWRDFLVEVALDLKMNPIAKPAEWIYPIDGCGGVGSTVVQPITESFLALDTWPDHKGAYLFACSCKPIDADAIYRVIDKFDLRAGDQIENQLAL